LIDQLVELRLVWLTEEREPSFLETLKRAQLVESTDIHVLHRHKVKGLAWPTVVRAAIERATSVKAEMLIVDTVG
jgi:hypothetical protein